MGVVVARMKRRQVLCGRPRTRRTYKGYCRLVMAVNTISPLVYATNGGNCSVLANVKFLSQILKNTEHKIKARDLFLLGSVVSRFSGVCTKVKLDKQ